MKVIPYLLFDGDCEEALHFYVKTIGATIAFSTTHGNSPMAEATPADQRDKILHATFRIGESMIYASDAPPARYEKPSGFSVALDADSPDEAERIFAEMSADGLIHMPIQETFWAHRFGMLVDRFGIPWIVSCDKPM